MSISPWISFIGGLIVGGLIGLFMGRKNYESCRDQLAKMTAEIQARKAELGAIESKIGDLHETLEAVEEAPAPAEGVVSEPSAVVTEESVEETKVHVEHVEVEEAPPETAPDEEVPAPAEEAASARSDAVAEAVEATTEAASESEEMSPAAAPVSEAEVETIVSRCPQKLARIHGIGRVYEDKLYHAGIGTFWQVATTPNEKLAEIFGIKDFQAVDLDAIKADARRLAEETGTVGHVWSGQKPDDFESLPGIGKTYEARLYDAGVCTFEKLAALSEEELAAIVKAPKWNQPDYAAWIAYARERVKDS